MKNMISVIVPAFNAEKTIGKCIESILAQEFEEEFELIVVDDASKDATVQKAMEFGQGIVLVEQKHAGPAVARNNGAKKAKGEIIVFTDADCVASASWLREMIAPFSDKNVAGVQGAYKTKQKSLVARFCQIEIEERYERMKKAAGLDWIGSYSAAYKKKVFLDFSGFDESFPIASGEDPELSYRMAEKGLLLVFNPKAIVFHQHPESLGKYLKTKFFRAYWRVQLYGKHKKKAIKDSYTPQSLKIQIGLLAIIAALLLASLLLALAFQKADYLRIYISLLYIFFLAATIKFCLFAWKKDRMVAIHAFLYLVFFRGFAFTAGLIARALGVKFK